MIAPKWTIYCHTHADSGRCYVGLTKLTMMKRWNQHVQNAKSKRGKGCAHFWSAIRKYGPQAFSHEVLEVCYSLEVANLAEECWIELFDTRNPERGFNVAKGGLHVPHPVKNPWDRPEYRERASAAARRKWDDPAFRAACVAGSRETWSDPQNRAAQSVRMKEVAATPEGRAQRRRAAHPGKTLTSEHRAKISENNAARRPEVRAKIAERARSAVRPRKEMCSKGHSDFHVTTTGRRYCRTCNSERVKAWHGRRSAGPC